MGVTDLLARLKGVRSTGKDRWIACCPAHEDKRPSMTVRVLSDGRILLHDFAGCDTQAILDAVGMTFGDLFPEPLTREHLPRTQAFTAREALDCLKTESAVVAICASDVVEGRPLTPADADRVAVAAGRIASALEVMHG